MRQEELEQLKRTELKILKDFDLYCKEHQLRYYLIGGALLGAARYQGFIPWDDDIDVAMPREDYEKLQKEWKKSSLQAYFLQSGKTDPNYSRCILKLRMNGTVLLEKTSKNIQMHQGIYIDIFPIDYIVDPDSKRVAFRAWMIRRLMSLRTIKNQYNTQRYKKIKYLIRCALLGVNNKMIDDGIDFLCKKENHLDSNYAILFLHNYHWSRQVHHKAVLGESEECWFEGYRFCAPSDTDAFLKQVFGEDYLIEPEKEKRKPPHSYLRVEFTALDEG